jgi:hypothetical protein
MGRGRIGVVALAVVTTIAAAVAVVSNVEDDDRTDRVPTAAATTTEAPTTTTTRSVLATVALLGDELPAEGFLVVDGDELVVADEVGRIIGEGPADGFWSYEVRRPLVVSVEAGRRLGISGPVTAADPAADDCDVIRIGTPTPDCDRSATRPRRIEVVDGATTRTLIATPPASAGQTSEVLGAWRSAERSPDGRWVLAHWSGECESPRTFLLPLAEGKAQTVDGTPMASWPDAPASVPVGWTSDGRARFVVGAGACGGGLPVRGVYGVRPGGTPEVLYRATADHPTAWSWVAAEAQQ